MSPTDLATVARKLYIFAHKSLVRTREMMFFHF